MSAGTGVMHSEFNPSPTEQANLFQLWIFPKENGIKPRYDQKTFSADDRKNKIQTVASGFKKNGELYIHQDAALSLADLEKGKNISYSMSKTGNGAYLMVIEGEVEIDGEKLSKKDAIGISEAESFNIAALEDSKLLIVDVPMK
jgi:redox-sensitive bicupin YhaK (pirin superfamily)